MNGKIVLVGLNNQIVKDISNALADKLNMFFLDVEDLIKYNLGKQEDAVAKVGIEYFEQQVKKIVFSVCDYENTVINCPYDLLLNQEILQVFLAKSKIVFVNIQKDVIVSQNLQKSADDKMDIQILAYEELTRQLESVCHFEVVLKKDNFDEIVDEIKSKLSL